MHRPVSLLSRAVPYLRGVIPSGIGLVPQCCSFVSFSTVPITISSDQVALPGLTVSFPRAVTALLSDAITEQRLHIPLLGRSVP